MKMEKLINAERIEQIINVFGNFDENVKRIEQTFDVHVTNRGTELKVVGEPEAAERAGKAIDCTVWCNDQERDRNAAFTSV